MSVIKDIFSSMSTTVQSQISAMTSFLMKMQSWSMQAVQFIQQKVQAFIQTMTRSPKSRDDYWRIMGIYFSKKLVIISSIIFCLIGYGFVSYVYPWAEGKLWYANLHTDTQKYTQFNGKAKVYDPSGNLIYKGNLQSGKPEGFGMQYNEYGGLLYKGNFAAGEYSGAGDYYNPAGVMIYSGNFTNNCYEGEGRLYNDNGKLIYVGNFSVGQRSGTGVEYNAETALKRYYGSYERDMRNGNGVEFENDGTTIKYEGAFKDGVYSGVGKLYSGAALLYSGEFVNGKYEGSGTIYDLDMRTPLYVGEFKNGVYDGTGTLYDAKTSTMVYKGEFSNGKRQGDGTSYDGLGSKKFSGTFRGDSIDYIAYLGKSVTQVEEEFGKATYQTEVDSRMIVTYLNLDASFVFKIDNVKNVYACDKIILGIKEEFMGLGAKSTAVERRSVMGDPFSAIDYACPEYYKTVFEHLAININNVKRVPVDKYIMDNYFIRFYFNNGRTELKCIEIGAM